MSLFQHVRAALSKRTGPSPKSDEELDHAVRQIVSRAVASDGVVDIFAAAGLKKPDVSCRRSSSVKCAACAGATLRSSCWRSC